MSAKPLRSFILVALTAISICCDAQKTRAFKGRLKMLDGTQKDLINLTVKLIGLGESYTGTDGIFVIPINENISSVTLELATRKFDVIYPVNGTIAVPKDTNSIMEFIVGTSTKNILLNAIAQIRNEYKDMLARQKIDKEGIKEILDKKLSEFQQTTGIKAEELDNPIDIDLKKKEFYPVFSAALNNYTNEAKDLKDAFKFIARHAFDDPTALQLLTEAVNSYNVAYENLNKEHNSYEKTVNDLWASDSKTTEVQELFSFALGELHSSNIFVLNLKIRDINDYNRGNFSGSKKAFKDRILHEIEASQLQLERRLQVLDTKTQLVLNKLIS